MFFFFVIKLCEIREHGTGTNLFTQFLIFNYTIVCSLYYIKNNPISDQKLFVRVEILNPLRFFKFDFQKRLFNFIVTNQIIYILTRKIFWRDDFLAYVVVVYFVKLQEMNRCVSNSMRTSHESAVSTPQDRQDFDNSAWLCGLVTSSCSSHRMESDMMDISLKTPSQSQHFCILWDFTKRFAI